VSREVRNWISYEALAHAAGVEAAARDQDGLVPTEAFAKLRRFGVTTRPPLEPEQGGTLFRVLAAIGRGDLSVGRIFEGHVNALLLTGLFGNASQRDRFTELAAGGGLLGIWNTDLPGAPVTLEGTRLHGSKSFASGVDGLSVALITAATPQGRQLVAVSPDSLAVDRSWWRPLGMRASGSHVVHLDGVTVQGDTLIGEPDSYTREPWFSAGAIRFAAVHVGGMHAILDAATSHLKKVGRAGDSHQEHRLGQMAINVGSGYAWLDYAAQTWGRIQSLPAENVIAAMSAARLAVERSALEVLELAERSIGAAGMIAPHPFERLVRDLRTYLRQPNPDAALAKVGAATTDGVWKPDGPNVWLADVA
jgi:alkylation response protein AidB-like acyl-CoA dehydrogenase